MTQAVEATRGRILVNRQKKTLKAYYSSCCGGHTADSKTVFGGKVPPLQAVEDPFCSDTPHAQWEKTFGLPDLLARVGAGSRLGAIRNLGVSHYDPSGRMVTFFIEDSSGRRLEWTGGELRRLLGYKELKGTRCRVELLGSPPDRVRFKGGGFGHGVGLCQWGAHRMGQQGYSYKEILGHYYVGYYLMNLSRSQ